MEKKKKMVLYSVDLMQVLKRCKVWVSAGSMAKACN